MDFFFPQRKPSERTKPQSNRLLLKKLLEKEMATHSSILDWEIPWTEELCRLQSMGLQNSQM